MKNKDWLYIGSAFLAMFFWSFSFVWFKIAYQAYQPMTVILFRLIMATILLFLFARFTGKLQSVKREDLKTLVMLAFFEPFLYFVGESYGLMYISSTVAAVIVATIPLITPFAAWYFFKEKLSVANIAGLLISFAGVCMVVFTKSLSFAASPLGIALEFLAVLSTIGFAVLLKRLTASYNTFTILTYQNLFGVIMFLPFWLVLESSHFAVAGFHPKAFYAIVKLAVFASAVAFIFFTYAVKNIGVNRTNVFINLIPVFVATLAFFILGDQLSLQNMIGIGVTVAGLFLSQIKKAKTQK
ncbi:MAG: DMT family transporter [Prolixibacteraceae bacterium]|jgi:drug/metabolite transporter (DMT)-like permease|nr:DMT family transporter [Prolixibacteraceae bacterium]